MGMGVLRCCSCAIYCASGIIQENRRNKLHSYSLSILLCVISFCALGAINCATTVLYVLCRNRSPTALRIAAMPELRARANISRAASDSG